MQKKRKQKANVTRQGYVLLLITLLTAMVVSLACIIFLFMPAAVKPGNADSIAETVALSVTEPKTTEPPTEPPTEYPVPYPEYNGDVMTLDSQIKCGKALLIDCEDHSIVAEKGSPAERIYPASMTKLMTLIVAIEHIDDMDATFTMTDEILEPLYADFSQVKNAPCVICSTVRHCLPEQMPPWRWQHILPGQKRHSWHG